MGNWGPADHRGDEVGSRDRAKNEISTGEKGHFRLPIDDCRSKTCTTEGTEEHRGRDQR
jgi:hypothetical protein